MIDSRLLIVDNDDPGEYTGQMVYNVRTCKMLIWNNNQWNLCDPTPILKKHQIMKDLEENPELYNEVIVELRKRKLEKLRK